MEQQYQKAVSIVLKCRLHVENLQKSKAPNFSTSTSDGSTPLSRALDILKNVNQQGAELANTIKRSLMTIPNSPVCCCHIFVVFLWLLMLITSFAVIIKVVGYDRAN